MLGTTKLIVAFVAAIALASSMTAGCSGHPPVTPSTTSGPTVSSDPMDAGERFVEEILRSVDASGGWSPPLPPADGQVPRVLTEDEKAMVLSIAGGVPIVIQLENNREIVSVDKGYAWVGWNGHPDGVEFLDYEPVANGIVHLTSADNHFYPAANFLFHSSFGDYGKFGIRVAVDLETQTVVWVGGYSQFPSLPRSTSPTSR